MIEWGNLLFALRQGHTSSNQARHFGGKSRENGETVVCPQGGARAQQFIIRFVEEKGTIYQCCIDLIHQEQSCTSESQDAVSLIPLYRIMSLFRTVFFQYIHHVGCAINLHSITNSGLMLGGQNLSNRQTVFFLLVNPVDKKNTKIPRRSTWKHRVLHGTSRKHGRNIRTRRIGSTSILLKRKDGSSSNTIECYHSSRNTPAYCIPKVVWMEIGEVIYEKVCASPRPPPKISLKHDWKRELGSEVARQPDGEVVQETQNSQSSPTKSKPRS